MMDKMKYFFLFLLIAAAAYGLITLFPSDPDREPVRDLPLPAPGKSPLTSDDYPKPAEKKVSSPEGKENTSKKTSRAQEERGTTPLNLKLLGTMVNEGGSSCAIIQELETDRQDMVSVGSVVAGARVVSIAKDRVVLDFNGREEILLLGMEETRSAGTHRDQGRQESAPSTYVLSREVVRENLEDLPSLLNQARAEIYYKEGSPEGFQLSQIEKGSIITSAGFQDGDVIQSVNGQEIRSLKDAIALYHRFGDSHSFTIGILREEKPKTLHVKIR